MKIERKAQSVLLFHTPTIVKLVMMVGWSLLPLVYLQKMQNR